MTADTPALLPTLRSWELDPDAATPRCPTCNCYLGLRRAEFSNYGKPTWVCDGCGAKYDA